MPEKTEKTETNIAALAFMGDAVYELYVRKHVMEAGIAHSDVLHRMAVEYVSAEGQAKAVRTLLKGELTEEETALVKRARNHKATRSKKTRASHRGSDIIMDKYATAFEALLGSLYLEGDTDRLEYLIGRSFEITEKG